MNKANTDQTQASQQVSVSVVMPSLNQATFIERSIRSVLSQSTIPLELIVMDGGSTDGTQAILSRLAQEANGRLRWKSETDRGPVHAVNKAMAMAQGNVIGWLNADDIYMPGAVERVIQTLDAHPEWLMVYGHAQHIDECDKVIGDYPTRLPDTPLEAFADGCFICQPTVFLRKDALNRLGRLTENLETAFDFEWWLRMFSQQHEAIGFVNALQAGSRLHSACITLNQRETVIREGMQVLAQYLGTSPLHWFKTYTDEMLADYPHGRQIKNIKAYLKKFARSISGYLSDADKQELRNYQQTDARINLAIPDAYLEIYSDGWLPFRSTLRVRSRKRRWQRVELRGRHVSKADGPLQLKVYSPGGEESVHKIEKRGPFSLQIEFPSPAERPAFWTFTIEADGCFIPREHDPGSDDSRELACQIDAIRLHAK
ncbi:MAG: glycosyltransferase [Chromatiales bacterium]|nr:glycosyltransferase [Gammaproteobacteria bacterium]